MKNYSFWEELAIINYHRTKSEDYHSPNLGKEQFKLIKQYDKTLRSSNIYIDSTSGKKYGYINMGILESNEINPFFEQMKDVNYLILDIRNYPISTEAWINMAKKLLAKKQYVTRYTTPNFNYPGYIVYLHETPGYKMGSNSKNYYKGKVIILVDHTTISQAENESMTLRLAPNATVIGTQTAGADGDISTIVFPGYYTNNHTGLGWYYADGRQTQRIGIIPDIKVEYDTPFKPSPIDPIMQRALELIRTGK